MLTYWHIRPKPWTRVTLSTWTHWPLCFPDSLAKLLYRKTSLKWSNYKYKALNPVTEGGDLQCIHALKCGNFRCNSTFLLPSLTGLDAAIYCSGSFIFCCWQAVIGAVPWLALSEFEILPVTHLSSQQVLLVLIIFTLAHECLLFIFQSKHQSG